MKRAKAEPSTEKAFEVSEKWRIIAFDNGEKLTLHGVTSVDASGNMLRLMSDEGYILLNPERILYHRILAADMVR